MCLSPSESPSEHAAAREDVQLRCAHSDCHGGVCVEPGGRGLRGRWTRHKEPALEWKVAVENNYELHPECSLGGAGVCVCVCVCMCFQNVQWGKESLLKTQVIPFILLKLNVFSVACVEVCVPMLK